MDVSDKTNHRTHHTRFFEKLYGNLEKSSSDDKKEEVECCNSYQVPSEVQRREILNSPSESSGSSTEMFSINDSNVARWIAKFSEKGFLIKSGNRFFRNPIFPSSHEIGLSSFSTSILPSPFGALRLPMGFANDPHNHFAAFRKFPVSHHWNF